MPIVSILEINKSFDVAEGEDLFTALENKGYTLPHGCLSGSCGACRIEVTKGSENLSKPSLIEESTIKAIKENYIRIHGKDALEGKTIRLSCRAKVLSDVTITPLK